MNAIGHALAASLCVAMTAFALPLAAQQALPSTSEPIATPPAPPPYEANTGDAWIDARLKDLNGYAPRYPDAFVEEIARYLDVPRGYAVALGQQPGWAPGDVYFACALGKVLAQPCRAVVRARTANADGGWKGVASRVAGEGTPVPTRALRDLLLSSYAHWERPID